MKTLREQLEHRFTFHPATKEQGETYTKIRAAALEFALLLEEVCPHSRELSTALTHLDSCVFHANASIARNQGEEK